MRRLVFLVRASHGRTARSNIGLTQHSVQCCCSMCRTREATITTSKKLLRPPALTHAHRITSPPKSRGFWRSPGFGQGWSRKEAGCLMRQRSPALQTVCSWNKSAITVPGVKDAARGLATLMRRSASAPNQSSRLWYRLRRHWRNTADIARAGVLSQVPGRGQGLITLVRCRLTG
jgi:hypothetical protein